MGIDVNNQPHIVFLNGILPEDKSKWKADNMSYTYKFARWNGKQWDISDITTTDSMWDMGQAIFPGKDGTVDVYLIAGGSVTTYGRWGGDLQYWRSFDYGKTWAKVKDIITFAYFVASPLCGDTLNDTGDTLNDTGGTEARLYNIYFVASPLCGDTLKSGKEGL